MTKKFQNIGTLILVILVTFALCIDGFYLYYHFNKNTQTVAITNIGSQVSKTDVVDTNNATEQEMTALRDRVLFDVNFYDNTEQNGVVLGELRMNYFMSYRLETVDYRSSGLQIAFNQKDISFGYKSKYDITTGYNSNKESFYSLVEYDTTDGVSWNGTLINGTTVSVATGLKRDVGYIVRIDNEPYMITLDGQFIEHKGWFETWSIVPYDITWSYTFEDIFLCCLLAAQTKNISNDEVFIQLDLSPYFSIKKYNAENGKFVTGDYTDILKSYCVCRVNYSTNGALNSSQSLFGIIANNPSFNVSSNIISTEYWNANTIYTLSQNIMDYRYSEVYDGYFVALSQSIISQINLLPTTKVDLLIDLSATNKNIIGIDYNAFQNLKVDSITIRSSSSVTFYILDNAFIDCELSTLYRTNNITLNISSIAFNNAYTEVVL